MTSKIDRPLDELVGRPNFGGQFRRGQGGRGRGRGNMFRGRGRGRGITTQSLRAAASQHNGMPEVREGGGVNDLRDLIISKTRPIVTDLRSKLPPKQNNKFKSRGGGARADGRGQTQLTTSSANQRSNKQPANMFYGANLMTSGRLPTAAEAKKITVTVQGLTKTTSEVRKRRGWDSLCNYLHIHQPSKALCFSLSLVLIKSVC